MVKEIRMEEGKLKEKPRSPKESIFNKSLLREIVVSGFLIGFIVFVVWITLLNILNMDVNTAR